MTLPKKYSFQDIETKWSQLWVEQQIFRWDPSDSRKNTYVVDTPPPTVSGSLHIGHVFSYTQTDIFVRFQRMMGKNIFYPIGWDDNGLPTEKRIQELYNVKCTPHLPYDPALKISIKDKKQKTPPQEISRKNFIEICAHQTRRDEIKYKELWTRLGLSLDWEQQYETINPHCQKIAQRSFVELYEKNEIYSSRMPIPWDTEFQTSVANADLIEKEIQGFYHDIQFKTTSDDTFIISTTRPELLPACIAIVAHPSDIRYQALFGGEAISPLFNVKVPILSAEHADPKRGTGILMICTFGDIHDLEFWKTSNYPQRQIISPNGTLLNILFGKDPFPSLDPPTANKHMEKLSGLHVKQARKKILELLGKEIPTPLIGTPKPTIQKIKFYEKGQYPIEYIPARQWYLNLLKHKKDLIKQGEKIKWYPKSSYKIYEKWVRNLNQDWCISRQRFLGVPFPLWYKINLKGEINYEHPILHDKGSLPIDPQITCPTGYTEKDRGKSNGFIADQNVMDTWATSSMTPQISSHWKYNPSRHSSLFPADLRPQAHEIIRTWAFYTITKSWLHHKEIPWKNITISGWVVTKTKEKISKSKGRTIPLEDLFQQYSTDSIRYWTARIELGQDTVLSENILRMGTRLVTKIFNFSKFVLDLSIDHKDTSTDQFHRQITAPIDISWIQKIHLTIEDATDHLQQYASSKALASIEDNFWMFCDVYVELVKGRAYQGTTISEKLSAIATLKYALKIFLKLFAPYLPYITEEIWSWCTFEKEKISLHILKWPQINALPQQIPNFEELIELTNLIIQSVRKKKSNLSKSLKWPVSALVIDGTQQRLELLQLVKDDIHNVCNVQHPWILNITDDPSLHIKITLADD